MRESLTWQISIGMIAGSQDQVATPLVDRKLCVEIDKPMPKPHIGDGKVAC